MSGPRGSGSFIRRHRNSLSFASLILTAALMLLFNGPSMTVQPKDIGLSIWAGLQFSLTTVWTGIGNLFNAIGELQALREEFESSKERLSYYEGIERSLVELRQENRQLREQLGFQEALEWKSVAAQIIAKDPSNLSSALQIDRGFLHGLTVNQPVVAYQNGIYGLVGKVVHVGLASATVQPLTDVQSWISARLQSTRHEGLVTGQGNMSPFLRMLYVRKRAWPELKPGDLVVTTGFNSLYPRGISLGRIESISAKDYETSLEIDLDPVLDLGRLEYVFVLTEVPRE